MAYPEIYLLRHGETQWNVERRFQGWGDSELTPRGVAQADKMGEILEEIFGEECPLPMHVSSLGRTQATAAFVQNRLSFSETVIDERLREVNMGAWEGQTLDETRAANLQFAEAFENHRAWMVAPESEGVAAVMTRITSWLDSLKGPVVAVSHGALGCQIRGLYLGLTPEEACLLPMPQDVVWSLKMGSVERLTL